MASRGIIMSGPSIPALLDGRKRQHRISVDLHRAVGEPDVPDGHVLDLIYRGSIQHYGYVTPKGERPSWRVQRLCDESCEHVDDVGPYDGRHCKAWGPMPYAPGDRLWVREAWNLFDPDVDPIADRLGARAPFSGCENDREIRWHACYRADGELKHPQHGPARWKSPLFMPRWASRLELELTAVRVERLQAITEEDARAEGVTPFPVNPEGDCWTDGKHRTAFEHLWNELHGWEPNAWGLNPWVWVLTFDVHRREA